MQKDKREIDKENLAQVIADIPKQLVQGLEIAKGVKVPGNFNSIMISGMGGSALPGNLLRIYLHELFWKKSSGKLAFGIYQNRHYFLPPEAYDNSLNIISSYSGNTEETIASFREALEKKLPTVGIAAGGKLIEMCKENNVPHILMPPPEIILQPRMATACNFAALFQFLANSGMVDGRTSEFESASKELLDNSEALKEEGKRLAAVLPGKTPVVYATPKFKSLAMIWKIIFNENSKIPAFWNLYPELNHNEMVGFTNPQAKFHVINLEDKGTDSRILKRFEVTSQVLKNYGIDSTTVEMPEGDILYKMFATLQIGCWASYYLALEYGVDPTPVEMVEKFKKML